MLIDKDYNGIQLLNNMSHNERGNPHPQYQTDKIYLSKVNTSNSVNFVKLFDKNFQCKPNTFSKKDRQFNRLMYSAYMYTMTNDDFIQNFVKLDFYAIARYDYTFALDANLTSYTGNTFKAIIVYKDITEEGKSNDYKQFNVKVYIRLKRSNERLRIKQSIYDTINNYDVPYHLECSYNGSNLKEKLDTLYSDLNTRSLLTPTQVEEEIKGYSRIDKGNNELAVFKDRKIKASFSIAEWWTYTASDSSKDAVKLICASHERITKDLELFKKIGVDGLSLCAYATYGIDKLDTSITTNHWYMVQKIDDVLYICSECNRLGLKIAHLKFMFYGLTNYTSTTAAFLIKHMDTFQPFWKDIINNYCKAIKEAGYNIDVVTVLNELSPIYNNEKYNDFVIELLNIPKKYNYKRSISCANMGEIIMFNNEIKDNLDIFCSNVYPSGSYNGQNTILEEQIQCWDRMIILAKALKEDYPNKLLYISETGCRDTWEALARPGDYDLTPDNGYTRSYGEVSAIFLKSLFESEMMQYVSDITYWYFDSLYNTTTRKIFEPIKKLFNKYLGVNYYE